MYSRSTEFQREMSKRSFPGCLLKRISQFLAALILRGIVRFLKKTLGFLKKIDFTSQWLFPIYLFIHLIGPKATSLDSIFQSIRQFVRYHLLTNIIILTILDDDDPESLRVAIQKQTDLLHGQVSSIVVYIYIYTIYIMEHYI